ncbi:ATP-binding protein [Streptacidiphilus rugosus]|uniref:ATP-binding protein n=1 Tax=Streptacidiphilus rugosus TaxID=405783 RepID=UPI0018DCEFB6|nr:ATP-binding protein [Streptacidiphilus rugosus]
MSARSTASTGRACLSRYDGPLGTGEGLRHVRETLARWGLDAECGESIDAVLVAGELLANAHQHGGGASSVELSWHGNRLRVAVSDGSPEPPRLIRPHRSERPSGHGLYLVERLTGRWGVVARHAGKTVWAELRLSEPDRDPTGLRS